MTTRTRRQLLASARRRIETVQADADSRVAGILELALHVDGKLELAEAVHFDDRQGDDGHGADGRGDGGVR